MPTSVLQSTPLEGKPVDKDVVVCPVSTAAASGAALAVSLELTEHHAYHHLEAAALFCRSGFAIEEKHGRGDNITDCEWMHRAYVMGSIMSSVAFLEAQIVEVLDDASYLVNHSFPIPTNTQMFGHLTPNQIQQLALVEQEVRSQRSPKGLSKTIWKYDTALRHLGLSKLNSKDVAAAIRIRNLLVHVHPTTIRIRFGKANRVSGAGMSNLAGRDLIRKPWMAGVGSPVDSMLCHANAKWVFEVCRDYAQQFSARTGLTLDFQVAGAALVRLRTE